MLIEFVEKMNNYFEATNIVSGEKAYVVKTTFDGYTVRLCREKYVKDADGFETLEAVSDWITRQGVVFETTFGEIV
jgi:hypothetical protein